MANLPVDVIEVFTNVKTEQMSIPAFKDWLKSSKESFAHNPNAVYQLLTSFDYEHANAKDKLVKLLNKYVDFGVYEREKLEDILAEIRQRKNNMPALLEELYQLYWKGYDFLASVALGFGYAMIELPEPYPKAHWSSLSAPQLSALVKNISPALEVEINRIEIWLKTRKIMPTGLDASNHYGYIDKRDEADKRLQTAFDIFKAKHKLKWKYFKPALKIINCETLD